MKPEDLALAPPLTQALFKIMGKKLAFEEGLVLFEQLHQDGAVSATDPWPTPYSSRSLAQAIVFEHQAERHTPDFYKASSASRLLALDPACFQPRMKDGKWWIWDTLSDWARCPERERYGWCDRTMEQQDGWAACVLSSLPDEAFAGDEAQNGWRALLLLGLGQGCAAFASRAPGQWLATDASGPLLRGARSSRVWDAALSAGVDPHALVPQSKGPPWPLWRAMLPKDSKVAPEKGSLRWGVESWISELIEGGHPDSEEFLRHKARWLTGWLGRRGDRKNPESERDWKAAVDVIAQQPSQWLTVRAPDPAWIHPFLNPTKGRPRRWAKLLESNPEWKEQTGPLGEVVLSLFERPFLDRIPAGAWERLAAAEHAEKDGQCLKTLAEAKVWGDKGPTPAQIQAAWSSHRLACALPPPSEAPSPTKLRF